MNALTCLTFLILIVRKAAIADQVCAADGTCTNVCEDLDVDCQFWAENGECDKNPVYMVKHCPKSCNACDKDKQEKQAKADAENKPKDEYGVVQLIDAAQKQEIIQAIDDMKAYMRTAREDPATTAKMHELLDNCKIQHELCAFWKIIGECEKVSTHIKSRRYSMVEQGIAN
jgi:ShK domain-like